VHVAKSVEVNESTTVELVASGGGICFENTEDRLQGHSLRAGNWRLCIVNVPAKVVVD
jgi:hypothetical protein